MLHYLNAAESCTNCSFLSDSNTNNALRPSWAVDYTSWKSTWSGLTQAVQGDWGLMGDVNGFQGDSSHNVGPPRPLSRLEFRKRTLPALWEGH